MLLGCACSRAFSSFWRQHRLQRTLLRFGSERRILKVPANGNYLGHSQGRLRGPEMPGTSRRFGRRLSISRAVISTAINRLRYYCFASVLSLVENSAWLLKLN